MLSLDVAISTYRPEGIQRVEKMLRPLPEQEGVKYVVSWQEHNNSDIPDYLAQRPDVEIYRLDKKGLSNNRNNAIENCKADIVLIADDDLELQKDFADKILTTFEEDPNIDMALFKINFGIPKNYPPRDCLINLPLPKNYYINSIEMAFKKESFKNLRFNPDLGLGAPEMHCGEEELFVLSAIKKGLKIQFSNKIIASHPDPTTGNKITKEILRGQGYVIKSYHPYSWILRLPLKALRIKKGEKEKFFYSLFYLVQGALKPKKFQ